MKNIILLVAMTVATLPLFGQRVLDTVMYGGSQCEIVQINYGLLGINPKKDSYLDMVEAAWKRGLEVCPLDTQLLDKIRSNAKFEPEKWKWHVFVATTPYPDTNMTNAALMMVYVPTITSLSNGGANIEYFYDPVGKFTRWEDRDSQFPPLRYLMVLSGGGIRPEMPLEEKYYDWIFLRKIQDRADF